MPSTCPCPPPGFRFQPSDAEIIGFYLINKILGRPNAFDVISTVDVYSNSPDQLPLGNAGHFEENEWYFYTTRPNSSHFLTKDGYFATSMDEQIFHNNQVVGFKQILRFYLGRPPTGMKTNWVVHEFRVNPNIFPAGKLDNVLQVKLSSFVMCKILHTQELFIKLSEKRVRDERDSLMIDTDEMHSKRLNLQIR
ncbi:NAC domain-containing protein 1 [Rosa chinensis]|uniref:NAC domain-containing protein 1 n=1 Tax=Rosa chinensis TaxID=74649 RepID=UPI000D088492|nr:NAC domain-containing protein 1 [Rosa chinensis]